MRAIFSGLVRVVLATSIVVTAIAIAVGRQVGSIPEMRCAAVPRHQMISGFLFNDHLRDFSMLDVETGALEPIRLEGEDKLEHAAVSPWLDSRGRTHVAGMWTRNGGRNGGTSMGLGHFAGPEWSALSLVETEHVPASAVCWFPDTTSRILFAGRDGALYRFSFDDPDAQPEPLEWRTLPPPGLLLVNDPVWPNDGRMAGLVIASLAFSPTRNDADAESAWPRHGRLWWLKLSPDRTAITAAGRLILGDDRGTLWSDIDEGQPSLSVGADGRLTLAFLAFRKSDSSHHLRLAPLSFDRFGVPTVDGGTVVELPGNRIRSRPAFSSDGQWVHAIPRPAAHAGRVERIPVGEVLSRVNVEPRFYSAGLIPSRNVFSADLRSSIRFKTVRRGGLPGETPWNAGHAAEGHAATRSRDGDGGARFRPSVQVAAMPRETLECRNRGMPDVSTRIQLGSD